MSLPGRAAGQGSQHQMPAKFNVDLCMTFLNYESSLKSNGPVNTITFQELPASYCNFPEMLSLEEFDISPFCDLFELSI